MIFNRTLPLKLPLEKQHDLAARVHAMDFLVYAYVQSGNLAKAKAMETEALSIKQQDFSGDMDRFYFVHVHFPAQFAVETKAWKDAESLTAPADAAPDFQAAIDWARAIAAGHRRDVEAAKLAVKSYDDALEAVRKTTYAYVADQMATQRDEAHAC
jgi:hypothetical protein